MGSVKRIGWISEDFADKGMSLATMAARTTGNLLPRACAAVLIAMINHAIDRQLESNGVT
jgi:hypothetical protein